MDSDPGSTTMNYHHLCWIKCSTLNVILEGLGHDYLLAARKRPSFKERKRRT